LERADCSQFLHDNINDRTDEYGGSIENRCRFPLQIVRSVVDAIGANRVGLRLAPFGLFQGTHDSNPVIHWSYLCRQLRPINLAYVHIIEPREDLFKSVEEKIQIINERAKNSGTSVEDWMSLKSFRRELGGEGGTVLFSAGGYNFDNPFEIVENGEVDAVVYGRYGSCGLRMMAYIL
jgi:2,4-dienoyl-CoA reductase-like NADH-dependent reductase (Old Yellow Enzyme family)